MPLPPETRIQTPLYGGAFTTDTAATLPFVLPGELVAVDSLQILQPSPDRIGPACDHFGSCGGCQYQHTTYPAQLALKTQILQSVLAESGIVDLPEINISHAEPWGYRNRIRLRLQADANGEVRAGYSRRATNEFLPIHMCPIAAPLLWRAAAAIVATQDRHLAAVSELELFCTGDESRLQLQFFLREPLRDASRFAAFCEGLRNELPQLTGVGAELDPELNRRVRRRWDGLAWGAPGLNYVAADRTYWVSRGAFFQVNRHLVNNLVKLVTADQQADEQGTLAWDLFAGVGLFTRALAERFTHVVAVEAGDAAAADVLAASRGGKAFEPVHASTLDFLRTRELQRDRPDLIVLDPPRAGLGADASTILARLAVPRVVYVSCDPVTLARDLAILTRTYRIDTFHLVDLFPQTFHMETVVHLSRRPV